MVSTQEPTMTASPAGVSVEITPEPAAAATTVADVTVAEDNPEDRSGLGVGLMVLLVFTVTILAALGDTAVNGSITYITGAVFVVISVIAAATIGYRDLSTTIITPPLAYFTAILIAGQPDLLDGATDNLVIREGAMVIAGLAFNAPWIFAGTGAAAVIVVVRRWILHR
jgi:Domain of unknown function (DUF6542)